MRIAAICLVWTVMMMSAGVAFAQNPPAFLTIDQQSAPPAYLNVKFNWRLTGSGGSKPYVWQVSSGRLPPGLSLDADSGRVSGTPTLTGQYPITVTATDSQSPPLQAQSNFTLSVTSPSSPSPLTLDWKQPARVHDDAIQGSVEVANHSDGPFDLTVVVLAVNEIGRATALGYQRFVMPPQSTQLIPFGATPGPGKYLIHADAVAEIASTNSIYRARKETTQPLHIHTQ